MRKPEDEHSAEVISSARTSIIAISFGLAVLMFLVAIERPHWFYLRPISGTAQALSLASSDNAAKTEEVEQAGGD